MLSENIERLLRQRYYRDDNETWEGLVNRVVSYVCSEDKELEPTAYQDILERVWLPNSPCLVNAGKRKNSGLMACQPGWVRVHTTNGFYSIKEIVENKINANLDTYWQESAVTNFSQNGTKEVIEVETEKGYRLYVTRDHLVYCIDKKHTSGKRLDGRIRGEWRYGGDLKIGDMLIMPAKESTFSVEYQRVGDHILDESLAEFVAYLQADGHLKKHTSGYTSETLVCEIIVDSPQAEEIFKKFFPRYNVIDHPSGVKRMRGYGNDYNYLLDICDYGTYSATIPEQIYKSPMRVVSAYLRGWFDAEGHVSITKSPKGYDSVKISMSTCSEEIARGVQFLLKTLGIISAVYYIRDKRKTRADRWDVVISHKYDNRRFYDLVGFINPRKQNKLRSAVEHIKSESRRRKEHFVIKSITNIGYHSVYDISTENETYLSDGFVVHNCFVAGPGEDDLGIHVDTLKDIAQVAKHGGGCGFTGTFIRAKNKPVAGSTHGYSYGPCAYSLRVSDYMDMMTQSGFRRMALMFTLKSDHEDLDEFISMKQTKDERLGYNFNQSIMATDKWMKAAINDPDSKEAKQFDRMVYNAWSNGEPGLLFHDTINRNTPYLEDINCSNPCGEQPLPEYGSCNLGSINIAHERFIKNGEFDYLELENVTRTITRFLDNVGTMNVFPNEKFRLWYENNRPIGIGVMGYADALLKLELKYGDRKALGFLHDVMSTIYRTAKNESEKLAVLRGLPEKCKQYQRRNITLVSIAPTGSIAFIAECSHGIEPIFSPTYIRTDERGETYTFEHEYGNKPYFMSAINSDPNKVVTWKQHVKTQLVAQKECDSGVSKTINFPSTASVDDVRQAFIYAWKNGAKGLTVYRDKSRETQVLQVTEDEVNNQSCVNGVCNL